MTAFRPSHSPGLGRWPWPQDFERYRARIDALPALIVVDWAVPRAQPTHPVRLLVRAGLQAPTDDGLLAPAEQAGVEQLVETVVDAAVRGLEAIYVGRIIHAGSVILAFYLPRAQKVRADLVALLQPELAPYELAHDAADDPKWTYYAEMLYPDPYSLAIMNSLRQLTMMEEKGDDPTIVRLVDHTAFFPDGVAARGALQALVEGGYHIHTPLPPRGDAPWALSFQRESALTPADVDGFCRDILTAISPFAGTYDGFRAAIKGRPKPSN
jgi:hypothetical protein